MSSDQLERRSSAEPSARGTATRYTAGHNGTRPTRRRCRRPGDRFCESTAHIATKPVIKSYLIQ